MEQVDFLFSNVYSKTSGASKTSKDISLINLAEEPELFRPHNYIFVHDQINGNAGEDGWIALSKKPKKLPKRKNPAVQRALVVPAAPKASQWLIVSLLKDALGAAVPLTMCFIAGLLLLRIEKWMSQHVKQRSSTGKVGVLLTMLWRAWACRSPVDPLDVKIV